MDFIEKDLHQKRVYVKVDHTQYQAFNFGDTVAIWVEYGGEIKGTKINKVVVRDYVKKNDSCVYLIIFNYKRIN